MPRSDQTRPSPEKLRVDAMVKELKEAATCGIGTDTNANYLVLSYDIASELPPHHVTRTRVYMMPARTAFKGFGGSRGGMQTGNTASLIIRQTGPFGLRDTEYSIYDADAWGCINTGLKLAAAQGTLYHVGTVQE